jgi:hypothetical protein
MDKRPREVSESEDWGEVTRTARSGKLDPKVQCKYCKHVWYSRAVSRVVKHLSQCSKLPEDLLEQYNNTTHPPKKPRSQSTLSFDDMPMGERQTLDRMLAEAVYASGIPFSFVSTIVLLVYKLLTNLQVENPAFRRCLKRLRPSYRPPHCRALAGYLLDDAYAHTNTHIDRIIGEASGHLTLVSDSWSNQRSESITNYVVTTRKHAIFIGSEPIGATRHTAEVIAAGISKKIDELGGGKAVIAVTTDNASNMRKAWQKLQQHYASVLTLGCASHTVNPLVNDILAVSNLAEVLQNALQAIKYFKSSNARTGALDDAWRASGDCDHRISLKWPVKTRWQGKLEATNSLIKNKPYIPSVIANPAACLGTSLSTEEATKWESFKVLLEGYQFWEELDKLHRFLKPYLAVTLALESNTPRGSRVYAYLDYDVLSVMSNYMRFFRTVDITCCIVLILCLIACPSNISVPLDKEGTIHPRLWRPCPGP